MKRTYPALTMHPEGSNHRSLGLEHHHPSGFRPESLLRCAVAKDYARLAGETIGSAFEKTGDVLTYQLSSKPPPKSDSVGTVTITASTAGQVTAKYTEVDGQNAKTWIFEPDTYALLVFEKIIEDVTYCLDDGPCLFRSL